MFAHNNLAKFFMRETKPVQVIVVEEMTKRPCPMSCTSAVILRNSSTKAADGTLGTAFCKNG